MNGQDNEKITESREEAPSQSPTARTIILALGGFFLLGIALALLLFGEPLLSGFMDDQPVELPQIPKIPTTAVGSAGANGPAITPLVAGDIAHDFTLRDIAGNDVSLSDYAGRPVVINFWATWCAPCRIEMPELQAAYEAYEDQDLQILAVNAQEEQQQVQVFFDEMGFTFTALLDSDGQAGRAYGALGLPSTYFVDPSGNVQAVHRGILTGSQIEEYVAQILP